MRKKSETISEFRERLRDMWRNAHEWHTKPNEACPFCEDRQGRAILAALYAQIGPHDPITLANAGYRWVMNLDAYKEIRAAAHAAGAVYPEGDDPAGWAPSPGYRLLGLLIDVRDDGGQPHLERVMAMRNTTEEAGR